MPHYCLSLLSQLAILDGLFLQVQQSLSNKPPGYLNIQQSHGCTQYYYKLTRSENRGTYIHTDRHVFISALAQKAYDEAFLKAVEQQRKTLLHLQSFHTQRSASFLYHALAEPFEKLSPARKALVTPYVLPDDLFTEAWLQTPYEKKPFYPGDPSVFTERGFRVRSKSEKLLADKLDLMGIPYLYEYPLELPPYGIVHNDLTLLDVRERTLVRHEHFGLMADASYCIKNLKKMEDYLKAGFVPGYDLLFTFEGGRHTVDLKSFEKIIADRFS